MRAWLARLFSRAPAAPRPPRALSKRRRIKAYFKPASRLPQGVFGVALACGAVAIQPEQRWWCVPLALALAGLARRLSLKPLGRASGGEIDAVFKHDLDAACRRALRLAGISPLELRRDDPCTFRNGHRKEREFGGAFSKLKRAKKDHKERWTPREISAIHFAQEELHLYRAAIDLTTGRSIYEETLEIPYRDVLSVELKAESATFSVDAAKYPERRTYWETREPIVDDVVQTNGRQELRLHLTNGATEVIAWWDGFKNDICPDDHALNAEAALRLRGLIRLFKAPAPPLDPNPPPRIVRHCPRARS